jgi:hypothetical protein
VSDDFAPIRCCIRAVGNVADRAEFPVIRSSSGQGIEAYA